MMQSAKLYIFLKYDDCVFSFKCPFHPTVPNRWGALRWRAAGGVNLLQIQIIKIANDEERGFRTVS